MSVLDELLGVVPRATRVGAEEGEEHGAEERSDQHAAERCGPEAETDDGR